MTKDVLVTISGNQMEFGDEPIELILGGTYYLKNGKHYVLYEEQPDADEPITKNIVKFNQDTFEMTKKGMYHSYLMFERDKKTSTIYQTPAGPLQLDILTHDFQVEIGEQEMKVNIKYALEINYNFISECEVNFKVQAR